MKNNYNNFDKTCDCKNKNRKPEIEQSYSYYSRLLNKPFDTVEELRAAEEAFHAEQRAKEDKAAKKKADAKKVDDAFKALNAARRAYKEKMTALVERYSADLKELKAAFEKDKISISTELATAEEAYSTALKEFTDKHETYHLSLKDGDFETTIDSKATPGAKAYSMFDIFDWIFNN